MILLASSFFLRDDPKQRERMKPYPPLATLLVAATLRNRGHRIALFDATLSTGVAEFSDMLRRRKPRIVALVEDNFNFLTKMCTEASRASSLAMVREARALGSFVVVNGSDASDRPALYLEAGAHAVLAGEADITLPALVDEWMTGPNASLESVPGLVLSDGAGGVRSTLPAPRVEDLDSLPLPAWDLVNAEQYRSVWRRAHGRFSWNMVTSRGCPFGCNWCAKPIFGRRYAQRSPECVADEMQRLKDEIRPDHIWFADDIFGLTAPWIMRFAEAVADRDARIPFMIQCRADLMRPGVAAALAEAGAEEVWLGVESGSQRILDAMDKGTTIAEVRQATRSLRQRGIRACWFLQLGYPSETWQDILATRDLVRQEWPDDIGVSVSYPLPGTAFHAKVRAELGERRNWLHTDDLAMLFHGTYVTEFYRSLRDALHDEVRSGKSDETRWIELSRDERALRSPDPLVALVD